MARTGNEVPSQTVDANRVPTVASTRVSRSTLQGAAVVINMYIRGAAVRQPPGILITNYSRNGAESISRA